MAPKTTKAKLGRVVTPVGKALFCSGNTPSKFDATKVEGTIILSADARDKLQEFFDMNLPDALKATGIKASEVKDIFKPAKDRDGNPTGDFMLKAKTKLEFGQKFFDGSGKEFTPAGEFKIPNGSEIQMSIGVELMKTATFTGLVLRLQGTKVLSLPSYVTGLESDTGATGSYVYDANASYDDGDNDTSVDDSDISWD